jgi:hypothetical protein
MPRSHAIVLGVATFIFGVLTLFVFRQSVLLQGLTILAFLAGIPAFIAGILFVARKGGYRKIAYYAPLCAVVAAFFLGPRLGDFLRRAYFSAHLAELQQFAIAAPDSSPLDGLKWKDVYTSAGTTKSGHRYVFFWWGGGFPVMHTVLAYHSGTEEEAISDFKGEWRGRGFRDHWFILSD